MSAGLLRPDWPAPAGVHACTTLRNAPDGVSQAPFDLFNLGANNGDDPAAVAANRSTLRDLARLPSEPRWLAQVHGTQVQRFDAGMPGVVEADAAVTSEARTVLAILTADCLPVLFCADDGRELGAAHAGWRGLAAGVLEATVAAMAVDPVRVIAWLGPAAGPARYEIGEEVRAAFPMHERAFTATRPGHWLIDLYAIARDKLAALGLTRISGGDECTLTDATRFYSYRRDGRTGRMATLLWRD